MEPERFLSTLTSVILALALFLVVLVFVQVGWDKVAGGSLFGMYFGMALGVAVFVFVVWKGPGVLRRGLDHLRSRLPEPIYSCLAIGVSGALATGTFMAFAILLLGHTRPMGWELDRILPWMAIAFLVCLVCGLPLGMQRRHDRNSRVT